MNIVVVGRPREVFLFIMEDPNKGVASEPATTHENNQENKEKEKPKRRPDDEDDLSVLPIIDRAVPKFR